MFLSVVLLEVFVCGRRFFNRLVAAARVDWGLLRQ